jgi:hypothetical protein
MNEKKISLAVASSTFSFSMPSVAVENGPIARQFRKGFESNAL